ncbi:MAG TPA: LysM peptidoglycan-binding domain-containing protein, partial [Myxococcaceae bacterium]|nr:LysM peptidoglycan-binding domain-containing protein [Myxococcaceae bacterium]
MRVPFLLLCLAVTSARAQAPGGSEVEGTEVKQPAPQQPRQAGQGEVQTAPPEAPSQIHTVEKGDTLWDLSSKYLGSPWYWPKVWSYNPQIANPHWIYPGNQVRFYPGNGGAQETPTRAEVISLDGDDLDDAKPFEGDEDDV